MTRKKATANKHQYVPLEERPAFLAVLAALPPATDVAALEQLAADSLALFNDAVRGSAPDQAELARLRYDAAVYRLHGDSFRGCGVEDGSRVRLERQLSAVPGTLPGWGQGGEWLVEVNGMRIRAKVDHGPSGTIPLELRAVDLDLPFLSSTGFRSHFLHYDQWVGRDLGAAVRAELERCLQEKDWQPVAIADKDKPWVREMPAWLAPALEGVTRNGQQALPLSGRAPVEQLQPSAPVADEPKAALSNAERQREFRKRQKQKREQAKAEGRRTFELSDVDLSWLWIALNTHIAFDKPLDWELQAIRKLAGRLLAHEHSNYVERLGLEAEGVNNLQKQRDKDAKRGWDAYKEERRQNRGIAQKLFDAQEENKRLKATLAEIGAELGGAPVAPAASAAELVALQAEVARLRAQLDKQHTDNLNTIAELGKALTVTQAMQTRLKDAGLPHDYRQYLG